MIENPPLGRRGRLPVEERDLIQCLQRRGWSLEQTPGSPDGEACRVLGTLVAEQSAIAGEHGPLRLGDRLLRNRGAQRPLQRRPVRNPLTKLAAITRPVDHGGDRPELGCLARLADRLAKDRAGSPFRQAGGAVPIAQLLTDAAPQVGPAPDPRSRGEPFRPERQLAPELIRADREGASHRLDGSVEAPASA